MKRRRIISAVLVIVLVALVFVGNRITKVYESPDGNYQIVSFMVDKGGFGYSGVYYIKEKGLFSKWHKLGTGPFSCQWLSETTFFIDHSNPIDGNIHNYAEENFRKEYHVSEFF